MQGTRRYSTCNACRESKKKCDRKNPCSRCVIKGTRCFYTAKIRTKSEELFNITLRRRYIEAYLEGANPFIMLSDVSVSTFDNPTTDAKRLQYHAILASSTRSFGVPKSIYEHFEREAKRLANKLTKEYSYNTTLGFSLLSYHLWGENNTLSLEYRDKANELCIKALSNKKNQMDNEMLKVLHNFIIGLPKIPDSQKEKDLKKFISESEYNIDNDYTISIFQNLSSKAAIWALLHCYLDRYLYAYEGTNNPFNKLDDHSFESFGRIMKLTEINFRSETNQTAQTSLPSLLIRVGSGIVKSLILYIRGDVISAFHILDEAVDIFTVNDYLVGIGGPQYIIMFHSIFLMSLKEKKYDFANRINKLQQKQKEIFPSARDTVNKDTILLERCTNGEEYNSTNKISPASSSESSESVDQSFYWMSNKIPIPIIKEEISIKPGPDNFWGFD